MAASLAHSSLPTLWVQSYAGPTYHLALTGIGPSYDVETLWENNTCGLHPGWLELDPRKRVLYCLDEEYTIPDQGFISSWDIGPVGSSDVPILLDNVTSDYGPAHGSFIAPDRLAVSNINAGGLSVWDTKNASSLKELQRFHYFIDQIGPSPLRNYTAQNQSFPHSANCDPTGKFVLMNDRGSDLVHTYRLGWDNRLEELGPIGVTPGTGPRHAVFVQGLNKTFYYLLGELTNSLMGFEVIYHANDTIGLDLIYEDSAYQTGLGDGGPFDPRGNALPSAIVYTQQGQLVLSTRNDSRSEYAGQPSDTIVTYQVDGQTGGLSLRGFHPSGGSWPRSLAITRDGSFIAIGNQFTGNLEVFPRDPRSGAIEPTAIARFFEEPMLAQGTFSSVVWDD